MPYLVSCTPPKGVVLCCHCSIFLHFHKVPFISFSYQDEYCLQSEYSSFRNLIIKNGVDVASRASSLFIISITSSSLMLYLLPYILARKPRLSYQVPCSCLPLSDLSVFLCAIKAIRPLRFHSSLPLPDFALNSALLLRCFVYGHFLPVIGY